MTNQTTPKQYHPVHVTLHWLVALLTFALIQRNPRPINFPGFI
jgi:cytochrome b561